MSKTPPTDARRKGRCLPRALLLAITPLLLYLFLWGLGGFLVVGDPVEQADAVVLLSGGDDARLDEAVRIYREDLVKHLLITETGTIPEGGGPRASALLQRQAEAAGVAGGDIWTTLGKSSSTRDEAAGVRDFCENNGLKTIIVVTDPYHTRRTQIIFDAVFSGSPVRTLVRPVCDHWYQSSTWFFSLRGWQTTVTEYLKLGAMLFGIQGD